MTNNQKEENLNMIPPFFRNMGDKAKLEFDYEINKVKLETKEDLNSKMYIVNPYDSNEMRIVNYNEYKDSLFDLVDNKNNNKNQDGQFNQKTKLFKAFFLKRLVSKKKRRYEDKNFDLDMTYITKRVIAMGYPSYGCETIYRNSVVDVINLFRIKHNNNVKIYNLCVEKDRIYSKSLFPQSLVSLFPAMDHNPCPIKLILEFCVDLVLFLINNPQSVAAVHCKAGKGRTGVMICSYLIFSGLCSNSEEAFEYYARIRTHNNKGVTIPSQRRYVKYFESFLSTNLCKPYVHMIPQIIKYHIKDKTKNILTNFMHDGRYFILPNIFSLNNITIGPFSKKFDLSLSICNFVYKPLKIKHSKMNEESKYVDKEYYFIFKFEEKIEINSDIKIKISGDLNFYVWINFWYSTLELIHQFVIKHHSENIKKSQSVEKGKKVINLKDEIKKHKLINKEESETSIDTNRFLIYKDDNAKVNEDKTKNIDENEMDVFQIIDSLNHSTDLNKIIKAINKIMSKKSKQLISSNDFDMILYANDLDKFKKVKKMMKNFSITINYNMSENIEKK